MANTVWLRRVVSVWLALCVVLVAGAASAVGRVEWKSKDLKESEGHSWTVEVTIYLQKAPDVATLPMRFNFQPVVYYERTLVDGKEGPQLRKVPLENRTPLVESVDIGFMDPGTGQIQKRTKFSFKLTRAHGYEAGEYDVKIIDGRSDAIVGTQVRVVFEGENEVIDRRAMVFSGEKKKEKKEEEKKAEEGGGGDESSGMKKPEDDPDFWKKKGGSGTEDDEQNEEVEPKRGCGCRMGERDGTSSAAAFALALGALGMARLRRRRA